jgi:prefoldin subunit 5
MNTIQEKKTETTELLQKHRDTLAKTIAQMDEAIRKLEYEEQMIVCALQKRSEQNSRNR